jgi:tRNA1Val (adenine37-N6)-methyltransferase
VQYRAASAPNLVLIESRRGGKPSLKIEAPLILTDENGNDTEEVKRIYHRM